MIHVDWKDARLDACLTAAQEDHVVITRDGKAVALIIGVSGMDDEQVELGSNDSFWRLIAERRTQKTLSRAQVEDRLKKAD